VKYIQSCFAVTGQAVHETGPILQIVSKITTINISIGMKWGTSEIYSLKEERDRITIRQLE